MKTWIGALAAGAVALTACSSSDTTERGAATTPAATTAAPATTAPPSTTGAPATTAAPQTTAAPDTTVPPATTAAPETTVGPEPIADGALAAQTLRDAVDASLAATSFSADVLFDARFQGQSLTLTADASIDYVGIVADAVFASDIDGVLSEVEVLADGTSLWVRAEGAAFPPFPAGALWVQGDASLLTAAGSLDPTGLVGAVIALRGVETAEVLGTEVSVDGVEVTRFATSIPYETAVAAAADLEDEFVRAISFTGLPAVLDIEVTIGADGVVRTFDASIGIPDGPLAGELESVYRYVVTGVGAPISTPDGPDPALVVDGPEADALLAQLIG